MQEQAVLEGHLDHWIRKTHHCRTIRQRYYKESYVGPHTPLPSVPVGIYADILTPPPPAAWSHRLSHLLVCGYFGLWMFDVMHVVCGFMKCCSILYVTNLQWMQFTGHKLLSVLLYEERKPQAPLGAEGLNLMMVRWIEKWRQPTEDFMCWLEWCQPCLLRKGSCCPRPSIFLLYLSFSTKYLGCVSVHGHFLRTLGHCETDVNGGIQCKQYI